MYFEKSIITAELTVCPDKLVPPPLGSMAVLFLLQMSIIAETSSGVFGSVTPIGVILYIEPSVEYICLYTSSNLTSPCILFLISFSK